MSPAGFLLVAAIRAYKRHVSPHKGFACAHRVHLGSCSCSTLGLRAISRYGAFRGLGVLRLRLAECHQVAQEFRQRPFVARAAQAGFVDCDCDGSCGDGASCNACSLGDECEIAACFDWCGVTDCGDCSWDGDTGGCGGSSRSTPARQRKRRRGDPVTPVPGDGAPTAD